MKLKFSLLLTLLVFSGLILVACGPAPAPSAAPAEEPAEGSAEEPAKAPAEGEIVLTLMTNWGPDDAKGPPLQSIVEDFMAANPNIEIDVEIVPSDFDIPTKVETAFLAGKEPDIILHNLMGASEEWINDGVTIPVTDLIGQWGLEEKFLPYPLQQYDRDGELLAFPLEGFNWPMWYNTEIFEEAGVEAPPETLAELTEAAQKVREAGYEPFALGGSDWTGPEWFLQAIIGTLSEEEQDEVFSTGEFSANPNVVAIVEAVVEMRDAGVFADDVEGLDFATMNEKFSSGKAAIMHSGSWSYAEIPEDMQSKVVLGGIPLHPNSPYDRPIWWSGFKAKGVWITRNGAEKLGAAEKFVKFLYQPEMIGRFVEEGAMVPPLKEEYLTVEKSKLNPLFAQSLELAGDVTTVRGWELFPPELVADPWYNVAKLVFVPGTTADEVLTAMDSLYDQID